MVHFRVGQPASGTREESFRKGSVRSTVETAPIATRRLGSAGPVSAGLGAGDLLHLQRAVGNRVVAAIVAGSSAPGRSGDAGAPVLQRRGENPYAQSESHEGWDLTAHHVVPHSALVGSLAKLDKEQRAEILRESIPRTITDEMLKNLKVKVPPEENKEKFKLDLRETLVSDAPDDRTVSEIRLGDMRESFFEWQGGNQFLGPNTSIRPEPSNSKDDIDFDGKYFTSLSDRDFGTLTGLGAELKDANKEKEPDTDVIFETLKKILALTRDSAPRPFDATGWVDVGTLARLGELVDSQTLNRLHLRDYAFFKFALAEIGVGKKYDKLSAQPGGEYHYESLKGPVQVKGTYGYIPLEQSKALAPKTVAMTPLTDVLKALLKKELSEEGNLVRVPLEGGLAVDATGKKPFLTVPGYSDQIPCQVEGQGEIKSVLVQSGILKNRKLKTEKTEKSLYQYCDEAQMPTSCFLPQELYDEIKAKDSGQEAPARKKRGLNPNALPFYPRGYDPTAKVGELV